MTQEDLNQIRAVMREEIAANNEKLLAEFNGRLNAAIVQIRDEFSERLNAAIVQIRDEFNDRVTAAVVAIHQEFTERLGTAAVAFSPDFSDLRKELAQRMDVLDHRMEALERRLDRIADTATNIETRFAAMTRWANGVDCDNLELRNTPVAQQSAIDQLVKRLRPPQPPA